MAIEGLAEHNRGGTATAPTGSDEHFLPEPPPKTNAGLIRNPGALQERERAYLSSGILLGNYQNFRVGQLNARNSTKPKSWARFKTCDGLRDEVFGTFKVLMPNITPASPYSVEKTRLLLLATRARTFFRWAERERSISWPLRASDHADLEAVGVKIATAKELIQFSPCPEEVLARRETSVLVRREG